MPAERDTVEQSERIEKSILLEVTKSVRTELDKVRDEILAAFKEHRAEVNGRIDKLEQRVQDNDQSRIRNAGYVAGLSAAGVFIMAIADFALRMVWRR